MNSRPTGAEVVYQNIFVGDSEILFCGQQKCAANHSYGPTVRPHYLMVYVLSGKGIFRTRNTIYHLTKGATFAIFPGEHAFYMADEDEPWYYIWIAFRGEYLGNLLRRAALSPRHPVAFLPGNTALPELYENMLIVTMDPRSYVDVKIVSLTLDILYQYIRSVGDADSARMDAVSSPSSIHMDKAIDFISNNYSRDISVTDVARHLGITREHFYFLFKRQFKVTPAHFIRNYRLQSARILLITTDYPISRVAELTGFREYNYFSNQFRALNGYSPSQYRKVSRSRYNEARPDDILFEVR